MFAYNAIPLTSNTPQTVPMMWKFPIKPWFQWECLILGGWDYIIYIIQIYILHNIIYIYIA